MASISMFLLIAQGLLLGVSGCPNIVSRSEWGARTASDSTPMSTPVDYFVVHHTAGATCTDISSCEHERILELSKMASISMFLLIAQGLLLGVSGCPNIVSRSEWGARTASDSTPMSTPVDYFVVHHTAGATCTDISSCSSVVRGIQNYHMDDNGWWDIGYNFLIGGDGNVYEGRGWDTTGAHAGVTEYNTNSIGVSMMGNFVETMPTSAALQTLDDFVDCAITMGKMVPITYTVLGHQDVKATGCPGTLFYNDHVQLMPNYNGENNYEECPQ